MPPARTFSTRLSSNIQLKAAAKNLKPEGGFSLRDRKISGLLLVGFFVAAIILYWPTLNGGPITDDFRLLATSKNGGWLDNFPATVGAPGEFWRPMVSILLKCEWLLFGLHFDGYRIVSALFCAITALAIYSVLFKLTKNRWIGAASGLLFVLWPSHPETMVWIAGQTDGLGTCLAWLSLWSFVSYWAKQDEEAKRRSWIQTIEDYTWLPLLILALLTKESEIVLPGIIFIFAVAIRTRPLKEDKWRLAALAANSITLTAGYLWLRSRMLNVPMFGGGYTNAMHHHSALASIYNGFMDYHINVNLLNTFAPLSGRLAQFLGWAPDALILILFTFGVAAVLRVLPDRSPNQSKILIPVAILFLLLSYGLQLASSYDIALIDSVLRTTTGRMAACFLVVLLVAPLCCKPKQAKDLLNKLTEWSKSNPYLFIAASIPMAMVVYLEIKEGASQQLPYLSLFSYWLLAYGTRKREQSGEQRSTSAQTVLLMAACSVMALVPVVTVATVDQNLVNARFGHLASGFAIAAIVGGIWIVFQNARARQVAFACVAASALIAVTPVIGNWANSERLSDDFVATIHNSDASRIYVVATPGFLPSATTTMLGAGELDAAGDLMRNDDLPVIPGYFADGFSQGDHLAIQPLSPSSWRVSLKGGDCTYRSGRLSLVPCYYDGNMPPQYHLLTGKKYGTQCDIHVDDPRGEIIAVDEDAVLILRPDKAQPPVYAR